MGLLNSKYYSAFKAINKVRNNYAHKHDYNVILGELNVFKLDWADIDNKAFSIACRKNYWRGGRYCHNFLCWKTIHLLDKQEDEKRGLRPFFHLRPMLVWARTEAASSLVNSLERGGVEGSRCFMFHCTACLIRRTLLRQCWTSKALLDSRCVRVVQGLCCDWCDFAWCLLWIISHSQHLFMKWIYIHVVFFLNKHNM